MSQEHKKYILAIALLIMVGAAAYSNTFHSPFLFDDEWNIVNNPDIKNLSNLRAIFNFMPTRFITDLSLAVNYHIGGIKVPGYHLFNLSVHICAAIMVGWLIILTLGTPIFKGKKISGHYGIIAFFAALIFVSHPVQIQGVTYIIQRASSLATLFYVSSLAFYVKSRLLRHEEAESRTGSFYYALSFIALILAMFSKEMTITLPFMILLYEACFFEEEGIDWKRVLPFFVTLVIIPVTLAVTKYANFKEMRIMGQTGPGIIPSEYLMTQFGVIATYIRLLFIPVNQNLDYDYSISKTLFDMPALSGLILLIIILIAAIKMFRGYRLISFGIFWFFLTLLPESSIIPIKDVIFEHRLYLPMVGYAIFLVSAVYYAFESKGVKTIIAILSIAAASYTMLTYNRNLIWKDEFTLWNDTVRKSPNKARPLNNRGNAYLHKGDIERAMSDYNKAIGLNPEYANAYNNRGNAYMDKGNIEEALSDYSKAIKINPKYADAYNNRGNAYMDKGNIEQAISDYDKAIEIKPEYADAYNNRGNAYINKGDIDHGISDCNKAIEIDPQNAEAYNNRGIANLAKGNIDRALSEYNKAIKLNPEYADAYYNRGNVYLYKGNIDRALSEYNKAIKLNPEYADAYNNRGNAYMRKGDLGPALSDYDKAIQADPGYADAYNNRGNAYMRKGDLDSALSDYNKTIDIDPKHAEAYYNRAAAYFKNRRYADSWEDAHKAQALGCKIDPEIIEALKKALGK